MVENFCCLLEYYQFTLTSDNMKIILKFRGSCPDQWKKWRGMEVAYRG